MTMDQRDSKVLSGYEFVKEVISRNRFRAGDYLISAGGGECQWLEFKAVVRIGSDDADVQRACRQNGKSIADACAFETAQNLSRIAKAIVSLYNTRGGCILIGVCEKNGKTMPTAGSGPLAFLKGASAIIRDVSSLRELKRILEQRCTRSSDGKPVQSSLLFERRIIFYRGVPVVSLIVSCAKDRNDPVLYSEDSERGRRLLFRNDANTEVCDWPLVANQKNLFDSTKLEVENNDDLYQKAISLSFLKRPNPLMRLLDKTVHLFDRSFVAGAATYVFSPVPKSKEYARLRISFLYYGAYFVILNALLLWSFGPRLLLLSAIFVGLVAALCEIRKRIEDLKVSGWALAPAVMFVLLSSVAPARPYLIYVSSIGLIANLGMVSLFLKSPKLSSDWRTGDETILSQGVTLFVYLFVTAVQYPFILAAITDPSRSAIRNHVLAFVANLVPVAPSIGASYTAIVNYDGFCIGCPLFFYSHYVLLLLSAIYGPSSKIVIVPRKVGVVLEGVYSFARVLSAVGLLFLLFSTLGAIGDASFKKEMEESERRIRANASQQATKGGAGDSADKSSTGPKRGNVEQRIEKVRLSVNDYFAQAFASYYYCYSNEVSRASARHDASSDEKGVLSRIALGHHYDGLKNLEYSFFWRGNDDDDVDDEDSFDDDFDDDDYLDSLLSDRRFVVDLRLQGPFREYIDAVRQLKDSSEGELNCAGNPLWDRAADARQRLFDQFDAMKLHVDWEYIKWINRPRQ